MAEAVGIGTIGKNGLLFNSKYGPRLMLGGILTSARMEDTTWPDSDKRGCPDDCFICQEQCPAGAIEKSGRVNGVACIKHSMKSPIFSQLMRAAETAAGEVDLINHTTAVDDHSMYECVACVSSCPHV